MPLSKNFCHPTLLYFITLVVGRSNRRVRLFLPGVVRILRTTVNVEHENPCHEKTANGRLLKKLLSAIKIFVWLRVRGGGGVSA